MPSPDDGSVEDLADLYDNAPCGYLSLSPDGRIAKLNRTLRDWLGREEDELLGQPMHSIMSFGGKIAFETHLSPMLRLQGKVHEIALDLVDADGEKIPIIANAAERHDADGNHLFSRLTLFRAVERRIFERSLMEAKAKAEANFELEQQGTRLREQFIAVLGHDLRNPLAAIAAGLKMLERQVRLDTKGQTLLGEMEASLRRANDLIDDVMDFARGRLGEGMALDVQEGCDLEAVLQNVLNEVQIVYPDHRFLFDCGSLGKIDCDTSRLGQVAANLLANAASHGSADQPVRLDAVIVDERLILSVSNSGSTIPEEIRKELFEPFVRGAHGAKRGGLGLGLFIVNQIALAHGGEMSVTSTDSETRFTLSMPRGRNGAARAETPA